MQIKNLMRNECIQKLERVGFSEVLFFWSEASYRKPFSTQTQNLLFSNLKKKPQL